MNKDFKRKKKVEETTKSTFSFAVPAKVEEIVARTGMRGEAVQVRCRVLDGRDKNKICVVGCNNRIRKVLESLVGFAMYFL